MAKQETVIDLMFPMTVLDGFTGRAGDNNRFDVFNDCPGWINW